MSESDPLPKEELLRKILNMTTSDNDGQALVAIRKANKLLFDAGWSWDKLLAGKIKIVESPFKNIPNPSRPAPPPPPQPTYAEAATGRWSGGGMAGAARSQPRPNGRAPYPTSHPRPGCRWEYDAGADTWVNVPIPQPARPAPPPGLGLSRKNLYATGPRKGCYCCGTYVANEAGFMMKPASFADFNARYPDKWEIVCAPCNKTKRSWDVGPTPARVQTGETTAPAPAPDLGSL